MVTSNLVVHFLAHAWSATCSDAANVGTLEPFASRVARLETWLRARGGHVSPKVAAVESALGKGMEAAGGSRGLVAKGHIEAGEVLIHVPREAMLQHDSIQGSSLVAQVHGALLAWQQKCASCKMTEVTCRRSCMHVGTETQESAMRQIESAIWLAAERQKSSSAWRPWLDLLPSDFSSTPLALPEALLRAAYGGTELFERASTMRSMWRTTHDELAIASAEYRDVIGDYESFVSARLLVLSREHGFGGDDVLSASAMVPFADLLNHDVNTHTSWGSSSSNGFTLQAVKPIFPQDPITCKYGTNRPHVEMIIAYGFLPSNEPSEQSVELALGLDDQSSDALYGMKRQLLVSMDLYRGYRFGSTKGFAASGPPLRPGLHSWSSLRVDEQERIVFAEILMFLRTAAIAEADLQVDDDAHAAFYDLDETAVERLRARGVRLSQDLEKRAAQLMTSACEEQIGQMAGGLKELDEIERALRGALPSHNSENHSIDLLSVASTASAYLTEERAPYADIQCSVQMVHASIDADVWPDLDTVAAQMNCSPAGRRIAGLWASNSEGSTKQVQEL
eukprot:TRINITY_DN64752_c0_g1_i1.p1 TRINITY_DN64752_c0_g1~~TRINITY_DN64752_c0_g1_i1.p1  ORF type:complete len:576 (+),score=70.36 TRINITY_DN64752_c0_g1_i1:36-1730(+)